MQSNDFTLKPNDKVLIQTSEQSSLLKKIKQQINQLSKTYEQRKTKKLTLNRKLKEILQKKEFFINQKTVQQRKYKSLNLLVNQLQASFQKLTIQIKSKELLISDDEDSKIALENHLLRQELIKLNQSCKQDEKLYSFLKKMQTNKNNLNNFITKSNYIQSQTQLLAQLRSYLKSLQNSNLECRRKWVSLKKQKEKNQNDYKIYKIQIQRQVQLLKTLYEEYLQKINTSKAKIVNFNQTQKEKLLTDYLVHEVALIQQKRRQVQDQNRNLHFHMNQLSQEWQRVELQNKELNSFFLNDNRTEESKLALKMKTRIQQLRDNLIEIETKNSISSILNKKNSNLEYVRQKLTKTKQANDFLEMKQKNIQQGKFNHLDQKQIAQFFTQILNSKDEKSHIISQRCQSMNAQLRQLTMKEVLLQSQISNMEEVLKQNNIETQFRRKQLLKSQIG